MVPSREVVVRTIFIILLSVTLDNFVTQYSVQSPVLVDAPVIVDGQQRVATGVTTVSVAVYIVSGVSIHADHVFCVQLVVGCTKISLIACVYISEETVGIFCEFVVFHCPISVVKATTERILCVRVTVYVTWNTGQIIAGRSCVNRSQQTVTGSHCLVDRSSDIVSCKSGTPVVSQFRVSTNLYIISIHTGAWDNTVLVRISQWDRVGALVEHLRYIQWIAPGDSCVEEVFCIVICLWSSPRVKTGCCTLGNITLCVCLLELRQTADYIEADIRREANLRFAFFQSFTTLGCDDNHTIGSTDTIKCRSSLSFQDVDTFNIIRVDIYRTVGEVRSAHTTIVLNVCANIRRTGHRHSVNNVKRSVVTRERTCTTDSDLWRSSRHTTWRLHVQTGHLTLQRSRQIRVGSLRQLIRFYVLNGVTQCFFLAWDTHGCHHNLIQCFRVAFQNNFYHSRFDGNVLRNHSYIRNAQSFSRTWYVEVSAFIIVNSSLTLLKVQNDKKIPFWRQ